jgi:hypothetical protein
LDIHISAQSALRKGAALKAQADENAIYVAAVLNMFIDAE